MAGILPLAACMDERAVLYLDLDDTILSWADGKPAPGEGVREFLLWALDRFEVRWLTRWARDGRMEPGLLIDLCKLTGVETARLRGIHGLDWSEGTKLDGIAWAEHVVRGRPFLWLEDDNTGADHQAFLEHHGLGHCFHHCDVTQDPQALRRAHSELERRHGGSGSNDGSDSKSGADACQRA